MAVRDRLHGVLNIDPRRYRDRRFWIVQALVLVLAGLHALVEVAWNLPHAASLYFVPETLFLVPVGYAALNFGLHGSLATAAWSLFVTIPNVLFFHRGEAFAAAAMQLAIVVAVAWFVGHRVEKERHARERADAVRDALAASERRYRGLFANSTAAILVYDRGGHVHEANAAASALFGLTDVSGHDLHEIVGTEVARRLTAVPEVNSPRGGADTLVLPGAHRTEVLVEPVSTAFTGPDGQPWIQTSLHDVTEQWRRQERLRSYAARILEAQEEERRRIAQELHDDALQQTVVVRRQLNDVEDALPPSADTARAPVARAVSAADALMTSLREFTHRLRPPALDELGVVTCLRRLVADLRDELGVEGDVVVVGRERRMGSDAELAMFRIAQEALRNVERHARATSVRVRLAFDADHVQLTVDDDGVGFEVRPPRDGRSPGGLGLLGMEERAALLGGRLWIESEPGRGTRVHASIPHGRARPAGVTTRAVDGPPSPRGGA